MDTTGRLTKYLSGETDSDDPITEKFIGFGKSGTAEVHGKNIVISKDGQSVEITKQELVDMLQKLGMTKSKTK